MGPLGRVKDSGGTGKVGGVCTVRLHGDAVFFDHCIKMGTREPGDFQDFLDIGFGDSDEVLEVAPFDKRPELF